MKKLVLLLFLALVSIPSYSMEYEIRLVEIVSFTPSPIGSSYKIKYIDEHGELKSGWTISDLKRLNPVGKVAIWVDKTRFKSEREKSIEWWVDRIACVIIICVAIGFAISVIRYNLKMRLK